MRAPSEAKHNHGVICHSCPTAPKTTEKREMQTEKLVKIIQPSTHDKETLSVYAKKSNIAIATWPWKYDSFVAKSSAEVLWADAKRVKGTVFAVGLMCDVKAQTLVKVVDEGDKKTFKSYPAMDIVPGDGDTRFDPKLLHAPLGNQQFIIGGDAYPITHIESCKVIAKQFVDEWIKTPAGSATLGERGSNAYFVYIGKVAAKYQDDLTINAKNKLPIYAKQFVHLASQKVTKAEVIMESQSYDDQGSVRFVATTASGETSCAIVGSRANLGVFKERDGQTYTHAIEVTKGDQDYSKKGYMEAVEKRQETRQKRLYVSRETVDTAPCEGGDNTVVLERTGIKDLVLPGVLQLTTLQFDGPLHCPRPPMPKGTVGATRSVNGSNNNRSQETTVVQATGVAVKAMNVKTGTEIEKTPGPSSMEDPMQYTFRGATCLFISNACLEVKGEAGALTSVDDVAVSSEQLQGPLQDVLEMFMGIVDAISNGIGFVSLQDSSECVDKVDLTDKQKFILEGVMSNVAKKARTMPLPAIFGTSKETWDSIEDTGDVVMQDTGNVENSQDETPLIGVSVNEPALKTLEPGVMLGKDIFDTVSGLRISLRIHDGRDDDNGVPCEFYEQGAVSGTFFGKAQVHELCYIKVKVTNLSGDKKMFVPVYVGAGGDEEMEDSITLAHVEECELPYPLQKEEGEAPDGWDLRVNGNTVVRLRFNL